MSRRIGANGSTYTNITLPTQKLEQGACQYPTACGIYAHMAEQINTVSEVIDRLGGNSVVAAALGLTPNAVGNWRERGFPPETFIALTDLLNAKGCFAPPKLWKMREITS